MYPSLWAAYRCHLPVSAAACVRVLEGMWGRIVWKPS